MDDKNKNGQNVDQNQNTEEQPKKDGFVKRVFKRAGRDLLDIAIGAAVVATIWGATTKMSGSKKSKSDSGEESGETEVVEATEE